jgi:hypothetical protein
MSDCYDRQGNPIDTFEWSRLRKNGGFIVKKTKVGDVEVSTVWLGLDHGYGEGHKPVIFETLVFGGEFGGDGDRYCTEDEANAGHERWVAAVTGDSLTSAAL